MVSYGTIDLRFCARKHMNGTRCFLWIHCVGPKIRFFFISWRKKWQTHRSACSRKKKKEQYQQKRKAFSALADASGMCYFTLRVNREKYELLNKTSTAAHSLTHTPVKRCTHTVTKNDEIQMRLSRLSHPPHRSIRNTRSLHHRKCDQTYFVPFSHIPWTEFFLPLRNFNTSYSSDFVGADVFAYISVPIYGGFFFRLSVKILIFFFLSQCD